MSRTDVAAADRAQSNLLRRFLSRNVDYIAAPGREIGADLQQKGRLADAGIAADQHGRARNDAPPDRPVELGNAG